MARKVSNVEVTVINVGLLLKDMDKELRSMPGFLEYEKFFINDKVAFVEINDEIFVVNHEGITFTSPITDENPLVLSFYGTTKNDTGHSSFTEMMHPLSTVRLNAEWIKKYAGSNIYLEDFIRVFGRRLEDNYYCAYSFFREKLQLV